MAESEVPLHAITRKYTSKADLYRMMTTSRKCASISLICFFTVIVNLFLPSLRNCTFEFMLQVMNQKKFAFNKGEIAQIQLRSYREIRMSRLLKMVLPHPQIESYLPDKKRAGYKVDEWFVVAIVAKLEAKWFNSIVTATFEQRYKPKNTATKVTVVKMSTAMKKALMDTPFQSSKYPHHLQLQLVQFRKNRQG